MQLDLALNQEYKATGKKDELVWDLRSYYLCFFIIEVICLYPDFVYAFNFSKWHKQSWRLAETEKVSGIRNVKSDIIAQNKWLNV